MRRLLSRLIFDRLISLCPTWLSLTAAQWRSRVAEGHREATCLDGHEHEHGGRPMLVRRRIGRIDDDNSEGSSLSGAKIARILVFGRSVRIGTMMQSYASAAKLQSGGHSLPCGIEAMFAVG